MGFSSHRGCPVFVLLLSILCPLPSFADCGRSSTVLLLLVMLGPCQCFWCHQSPHQVFGAIIISVSASCLSLLCCFLTYLHPGQSLLFLLLTRILFCNCVQH
jgi:hypothetical protein